MPVRMWHKEAEYHDSDDAHDFKPSDLKIDEIEEDKSQSEDDSSVSDWESEENKVDSPTKKKNIINQKRCSNKKDRRGKFFVHNAKSFKRPKLKRTNSPTKALNETLKQSRMKLKYIKMNSTAFKCQSGKKINESVSPTSRKLSDNLSDEQFFQGSPSNNGKTENVASFEKAIISPVLWDEISEKPGNFHHKSLSFKTVNGKSFSVFLSPI